MTVTAISAEEAAVIWHDVECGSYGADLALWRELAGRAAWGGSGGADAIDLGAGTGRVALHLASRGHRVRAIDVDPVLVEVLRERAAAAGVPVMPLLGDARSFSAGGPADLIAAPMQLAHLLGPEDRGAMLEAIASHLGPGGLAAIAIMTSTPESWRAGRDAEAPRPDVRERDAWVFSSLPLAIEADGGGVTIRRLRQTVSPEGDLREEEHVFRLHELSADRLEAEAVAAGLAPLERHVVPETDDHVGSTVVVLEAGR